jgi:hypothetical protein
MNHNAIYALYPNVVTIDDTAGAMDNNGNKVEIDMALVDAWVNPNAYKEARASAYAPLAEQLDMQYHDSMNGTETWLDHIRSVKEAHPKEGE